MLFFYLFNNFWAITNFSLASSCKEILSRMVLISLSVMWEDRLEHEYCKAP